jgi:hypothetical protein
VRRPEIEAAIEQGTPLLLSQDARWFRPATWDKPRKVRAVQYLSRRTRIEYLDNDVNDLTGSPGMRAGDLKLVDNASLRGTWADLSPRVEHAREEADAAEQERRRVDRIAEHARQVFERHGHERPYASRWRTQILVDADALEDVLAFYNLAHDERSDRQDGKET